MFDTTIDLQPVIELALAFALPALSVLGSWAAFQLGKLLKVKVDGEKALVLNNALNKAIEFGIAKAVEKSAGKTVVDLKNPILAFAVRYALDRVPDTLKHFNITPESLEKMIEARFQEDLAWRSEHSLPKPVQ